MRVVGAHSLRFFKDLREKKMPKAKPSITQLKFRLFHFKSSRTQTQEEARNNPYPLLKRAKRYFSQRILKKILNACKDYIRSKPWLKSILLTHSVRLEYILRRINLTLIATHPTTTSEKSITSFQELTPRAQEIYTKLVVHFLGKQ